MRRSWFCLLFFINIGLLFSPCVWPQENSQYTIGPEDVIEITIEKHPEFSGLFHVGMDGKIQYTYVGDMNVSGLNKQQTEEKIKAAISKYCVNPQVNVIIREFQSKSIYVLGEVARPGKYSIHAQNITAKEAIVMAGLPTQTAGLHRALLITGGSNKNIKEINLYALLYQGDNAQNMILNPGDTLYVPQAGGSLKESEYFYVVGEVPKSGKYAMNAQNITVKEALMSSGVPTKMASMQNARIIRKDKTFQEVNLYDQLYATDGTIQDVLMYPGDTLYVPGSESSEYYVVGQVPKPGRYMMIGKRVSIREALMNSGMPNPQAALEKAKIISRDRSTKAVNLQEELYAANPKEVFLLPGDTLYVPVSQLREFYVIGEVPKPGTYDMLGSNISLKEALMKSGLPTKIAALNKAKIIRQDKTQQDVNLYEQLYATHPTDGPVLYPGDTLYIPATLTDFQQEARNSDDPDDSQYTLGPDDVVTIMVANYPEFSGAYPVSQEGKIQFSFAGDINVTGMTKSQLADKIKKLLSSSIAHPQISVSITEFKSKAFYVIGEVGSPGKYFMHADSIPVSEAIVMAGLPTLGAAMRKTQIITPGPRGAHIRRFNLFALLYEGNLKENLLLKPGDYVYVPSTVMAKLYHMVFPVASTVGAVTSAAAPVPFK